MTQNGPLRLTQKILASQVLINAVIGKVGSGTQVTGNPGAFDRSMQHHLIDLRFKDGVYEPTEAVEIFSHADNGCLAALEGGAVVA